MNLDDTKHAIDNLTGNVLVGVRSPHIRGEGFWLASIAEFDRHTLQHSCIFTLTLNKVD